MKQVQVPSSDRSVLLGDARWQAIQQASPTQIEAWLTANVTNLAQAREVLRVLILAVRHLAAR